MGRPVLERVSCRYGAPMGRPGAHPGDDPHCPIRVRLIPLDSGGYDSGGAYWGHGAPLWQARGIDEFEGERSEICDWNRAHSKAAAIAEWRQDWPNARIY